DPVVAREFPQFGISLLFVFGMRMATMFVFTTSNIGRGAGILPRWFTIFGLIIGLFLLLSASFHPALAVVFPISTIILCAILLNVARKIPSDVVLPQRGTLPSIAEVRAQVQTE